MPQPTPQERRYSELFRECFLTLSATPHRPRFPDLAKGIEQMEEALRKGVAPAAWSADRTRAWDETNGQFVRIFMD